MAAAAWDPLIVDWASHQAHTDHLKKAGKTAAKTIYEPPADTLESYKGDIVNGIKGIVPRLARMNLNGDLAGSDPFIPFELPDDSLLDEYKTLIVSTLTEAGGLEWLPYVYLSRYGKAV